MNPAEKLPGAKKGALGPDFLPSCVSHVCMRFANVTELDGKSSQSAWRISVNGYSHTIGSVPKPCLGPRVGFCSTFGWIGRSDPGFPAARRSPRATCAVFLRENRMSFRQRNKFDRKSGAGRGFTQGPLASKLGGVKGKAAQGSRESALQDGGTKKFGRLIGRDGRSVQGLGCGQGGLLGGAPGEARSNAARP